MDTVSMVVFRALAVTAERYRSGERPRNKQWARDSIRLYFRPVGFAGDQMKKTLSDARARQELIERLDRLKPETTPLWGKMNAPQMLAHIADWMLMAKGDLKPALKKHPLRYPVLKQLVIYWLPFPKGVPTARELISRKPAEWSVERASVRQHFKSFGSPDPKAMWPDHPVFGRMNQKTWAVLAYRHTDHHFRQFGV
jgi:hypothetical protein